MDSITQLTHERYKGTANIQICEVRQESGAHFAFRLKQSFPRLRAGRPQPELFRAGLLEALREPLEDILDEALDFEKKVLEKQRVPCFENALRPSNLRIKAKKPRKSC